MRLKEIHLTNFRCFEQLDIELPTRLAVFIGVNGAGKTAILDAICLYFIQISSLITSSQVFEELVYETSDDIKIGNEKTLLSFISEYLDFKKIEIDMSTFIGSGYGYGAAMSSKDDAGLFVNRFKEITNSEKKIDTFSVPVLLHYRNNKGQVKKNKTHSRSNFIQFTTYENSFFHSIDDFKDFTNWFREAEDRENEAIIHKQDFNAKNPQLEVIRQVIPHFLGLLNNQSFSELRIKRQTNNKFEFKANGTYSLIIKKDADILELNQLSDGERTLIMLVSDITRHLILANPSLSNPLEGEGIVLTDEIDLHLHPQWQKTILNALVNTFPNLQFIVTTHSPYVVTHLDLDDKQVQVYSIEKDKVVPIQSKGKDLSTASFEIFGVERRPKMYQKAIDDLFREFEADEPDLSVLDKKFLALKKQLGETDPEVESAKIIIEGLKL
jgi:predicted ATP-binding protein involved in virulence